MTDTPAVPDYDLLAKAPANRLVGISQVISELRRRRRAIFLIAMLGATVGLLLTFALPHAVRADTTLFVQLPANADLARGMNTELALLETGAVAKRAAAAPGVDAAPTQLHTQYTGSIASDNIIRITANGQSAGEAAARAAAVAAAFLATRAAIYSDQTQVLVTALRKQQAVLRSQADALTSEAQNASATRSVSRLGNVLSERDALNTQAQNIQTTIDTDTAGLNSLVQSSKVIDTPTTRQTSTTRSAALNVVSGFLAGLFLALGGVVLFAITSTRVRRRADVAGALGAPVRVSVGPIIAPHGRHFRRAPEIAGQALADLELVVRHLQAAVAAAPNSALVIVSIDSLRITTLAVQTLERALVAEGRSVQVVDETKRGLHDESDATATTSGTNGDADVVLVLATLDPGKGAEHLREWATNVVAFATAGRSTRTKLEATATMIQSAALQLRSVVLVNADATDDSLGVFPVDQAARPPADSMSESSHATQPS